MNSRCDRKSPSGCFARAAFTVTLTDAFGAPCQRTRRFFFARPTSLGCAATEPLGEPQQSGGSVCHWPAQSAWPTHLLIRHANRSRSRFPVAQPPHVARCSCAIEEASEGGQVEQLRFVTDLGADAGEVVGKVLAQRLSAEMQAAYAVGVAQADERGA